MKSLWSQWKPHHQGFPEDDVWYFFEFSKGWMDQNSSTNKDFVEILVEKHVPFTRQRIHSPGDWRWYDFGGSKFAIDFQAQQNIAMAGSLFREKLSRAAVIPQRFTEFIVSMVGYRFRPSLLWHICSLQNLGKMNMINLFWLAQRFFFRVVRPLTW